MKSLGVALAAMAGGALVVLLIWAEIQIWDECLEEHTTLYCLRVLSR